ncbi:uroporphyrinogen-III synthase [Halomonas sp. WWR20]
MKARRPPILVTRPGARAAPLCTALEQAGYAVARLTAMTLDPLPESPLARQTLLDLDQFTHVIVSSPLAAELLTERIENYWPQLPLGPRFYGVGATSAQMLHQQLDVEVLTPPAGSGEASEGLLTLPELQSLHEQWVMLAAGEGGRPLLAETLTARGARLTKLALYRRVLQAPDSAGAARLAAGDFTALVVTSGEILQHLAAWCGQAALNQPLIVSSRRLATLADTLGFACRHVARDATPAALAAAVRQACDPSGADVDQDDLEKG